MQVFHLSFLIVGDNPFLSIGQDISNGLSGCDELAFFQCPASQFAIAGSHYYGVGKIQTCHFQSSGCPLDGGFCTFTAV